MMEAGRVMAWIVAVWTLLLAWIVALIVHVNDANASFTKNCHRIGGSAVIEDRDLCLSPSGTVIDREHTNAGDELWPW